MKDLYSFVDFFLFDTVIWGYEINVLPRRCNRTVGVAVSTGEDLSPVQHISQIKCYLRDIKAPALGA